MPHIFSDIVSTPDGPLAFKIVFTRQDGRVIDEEPIETREDGLAICRQVAETLAGEPPFEGAVYRDRAG